MKRLLLVSSVFAILGAACVQAPNHSNQLNVVASFYPLAYFAEQVGGEYTAVTTITPHGVEPHDFTPTPSDILSSTQADVFIYNGGGLDTWAESLPIEDFQNPSVIQIKVGSLGSDEDPHVWLSPTRMQEYVEQLRNAFSQADPTHAVDYQHNAEQLVGRLQQLDTDYRTGLSTCAIRQAIVAHDAFQYLADDYHIELLPIVGMNPNETPSAQQIAELSDLAREHGIEYIFFEELTSPKLSQVLAAEVGAQAEVLSPVEGLTDAEQTAGADYFILMEQNLRNLQLALRCN
jgi:zinc transport system substrate-binding protein